MTNPPSLPSASSSSIGGPALRGPAQSVARLAWALFFALALFILCMGVWHWYDQLHRPCTDQTPWEHCAAFEAGLAQIGLSPAFYGLYTAALPAVAALPFFLLSLIIIRRRSDRLMAVLFAIMLAGLGATGKLYAPIAEWANWNPEREWMARLIQLVLVSGVGLGAGLAYAFPDGRFTPRWTRWPALAWFLLTAGTRFLAGTPLDFGAWPAPLPQLIQISLGLSAVYALAYRYRRVADPLQRQQIKWFLLGVTLLIFNWLVDYAVWDIAYVVTGDSLIGPGLPAVLWQLIQGTVWYASQFFFAVCIAFALFRYRLWDIDLVLNRALVYGGLTAGVVALYVLVVGGLGALLRTGAAGPLSLLATGLVAVLAQPLRDRLQRAVNRLMYGERDDPVTVLNRLGQRLETAVAPEALLPALVETVGQALKLPFVAVEMPREPGPPEWVEYRPALARPAAPETLLALPLQHQGEVVGRLLVAPRSPGEAFSPLDRHLLDNVAREAGLAVHAVSLTRELQRARQRLVTALEDERRRLRRDLHDGLGPALASQGLKLAAAQQQLRTDPAAASALIENVLAQNSDTVADVRRLVYGLRPPALDERGLAEAIRDHLAAASANGLRIEVGDLPAGAPPLPAAVEVAAYRIASEALTNLIKHARAHRGLVAFTLSGSALHVAIEDDGAGLPPALRAGVGLRSMRERAEELGGSLTLEPRPHGGTRVVAVLPLNGA
jgi:signal transduction histidine kinase